MWRQRTLCAILIILALVQPSTTFQGLHDMAGILGAQVRQVELLLEQVGLLTDLCDGFAAAT